MPAAGWIAIVIGAYLVIGAFVTAVLSSSPYSANGWLLTTLLWPLFVYAIMFG